MDRDVARAIAKLEAEVAQLRQRMALMVSCAGGCTERLRVEDDVYPAGEPAAGLFARVANVIGINLIDDHFQSGTIPTGYSWISDGIFDGAPGNLNYSYRSSYMTTILSSTPNFLAKSVTSCANLNYWARLATGLSSDIGIRIDDGSDDNYAEVYLDAGALGSSVLSFRYRAGGGAVTTNTGPTLPQCFFYTLRLYCYEPSDRYIYTYLVNETGDATVITGFNTPIITWTPARVGIVLRNNSGSWAIVDWIYTTFT